MPQKLFIGRNISSETKAWLLGENIVFEEHQLIKIEFCEPDFSLFSSLENKQKMWVISSQWAAKWMVKYHAGIGYESNDLIVCLSVKQAEICTAFTCNISVADHQNAISLASLVFEKYSGEQVVYLHGSLSLNIIEEEMKSFGTRFQKAEVYRNLPVLKRLKGVFDIYLFFSPSGAISFFESNNNIPHSSAIVAIGPTTAKTCKEIFGREVFISEVQDELEAVQLAVGLLQNVNSQFWDKNN